MMLFLMFSSDCYCDNMSCELPLCGYLYMFISSCDTVVFSVSVVVKGYTVKMALLLHVFVIVIASILTHCLSSTHLKQEVVVNCPVLVVEIDCYNSHLAQLLSQYCKGTCFNSLTDALRYVQQCHCTIIHIYVQSNVSLESESVINEISEFTLQGTNNPTIQCMRNSGSIIFSGVDMNVSVSNLIFYDCSINGTLQFINYNHFVHIESITMNSSTLVFINITGHVTIENSIITNIHSSNASVSGLYIQSRLSLEVGLFFELKSCHFTDNNVSHKDVVSMRPTRAAGVLIDFKHATNHNYVRIASSVFINNTAYIGGAISVVTNVATNTSIQIHNSTFQQNNAFIGSAIDMYCSLSSVYTHRTKSCLIVLISDSNFTDNKPLTDIVQKYSSTVSARNIQLQFARQVIFFNNKGSAMVTLESDVLLLDGVNISFIGNEAQYGGGLNLISSFVTIGKNTEILFHSNRAVISGGAIYSNQREDVYISYSNSCFIRYDDNNINPDYWNTTVRFDNNCALNGKTIFTTSVQPCMLIESENSSVYDDMMAVFCGWKSWIFKGNNCHSEVATSPQNFQLYEYVINTISGLPIPYYRLKLAVFDELKHNVTNNTLFTVLPSSTNPSLIIAPNYDASIVVYGEGLKTEKWYIHTIGERTITASMTITMQPCPPGFVYKSSIKDCACTEKLSYVHCLPTKVAVIEVGKCMSYLDDDENNTMIVYGRCIFSTLHTGSVFIPLPYDATQFCALFKRTGLLCGNCITNYSIDVFSDTFECKDCTSSTLDWCIYFIVESVPVFILFSVIIMLHISLTSGPVNGYIFYCQVITVAMEVIFIKTALEKSSTKHPTLLTNILIIPADIFSLDFFRIYKLFTDRITCLGSGLTVVHLTALQYLSAIYPLILLVITYISIELHARNCCYIVRIWRPISCFLSRFRQSWNIRTSIVDGFAAFILLSYVKIIRVSIILTTYNEVHNENGTAIRNVLHYDPTIDYLSHKHTPFMFVGTLLLLTFGLLFPLLLIFYQFAFLQKCLNTLNLNWNGLRMFMDSYQGCYKDGKNNGPDRRYFAGLYFIFRIIVFCLYDLWGNNDVYVLLESFMILFALLTAILRPYKNELLNYIDTFFFSLLAVVYGLHMYIFENLTLFTVPNGALYAMYALQLIPFIYLICFMSVWYGKRFINHKRCTKISIFNPIDTNISWRFDGSTDEINLLASERDNIDYTTNSSIITQRTMLRDSAS